jgi:dCTP deaminase
LINKYKKENKMPLSNLEILQAIQNGDIIISPFNKKQLNTNSYDVTLGEYYFAPSVQTTQNDKTYDPSNEESIREYWQGPFKSSKYIHIPPRTLILGHTAEFIGTSATSCLVPMISTKSSLGRHGISTCKCANCGSIGYHDRWALEIENHLIVSRDLQVGEPVAQITFFRSGETDMPYTQCGNYQTSGTIDEMVKNWRPENILPLPRKLTHTTHMES